MYEDVEAETASYPPRVLHLVSGQSQIGNQSLTPKPKSDLFSVRVRKSHTAMLAGFPAAGQKWHSCSRGAFAPAADTSQLKREAVLLPPVQQNMLTFPPLLGPIPKAGSNVNTQCEKYPKHLS